MKKIFFSAIVIFILSIFTSNVSAFWHAKGEASLTPNMDGTFALHCGPDRILCASYHGLNSVPGQGDKIRVFLSHGIVELTILSASYSSIENTDDGPEVIDFEAVLGQ